MSANRRVTGTVRWFNNDKGYGFIDTEEVQDIFVHYRSVQVEGFKTLREKQKVEFTMVQSQKGAAAMEVVPISNNEQE